MPGSTSRNLIFPVIGDIMEPLAGWFAQLAASTNDAIDQVYDDFEELPYPAPQSIEGAVTQQISATAWADLPNAPAITFDLPQACWVTIVAGAWLATSATGDVRCSVRVTGATTLGESQVEVGGTATAWGQVMYSATPGTQQTSCTRFVRLNAGSNVINLRAYRNGGATANKAVNYSTLQVSPVRWA